MVEGLLAVRPGMVVHPIPHEEGAASERRSRASICLPSECRRSRKRATHGAGPLLSEALLPIPRFFHHITAIAGDPQANLDF